MSNINRTRLIGALLLAGITLAVFWPVTGFEFINFDDPEYVSYNPMVQKGVTAEGVAWAFRTSWASNWHPLTWISHMLDYAVYGLKPGGHHFTNLLLHTANAVLLFLLLQRLTGGAWRSFLVAALFAWHPLHVESVAWVSERKDVLSTFFWLLTMASYAKYAETLKLRDSKFKIYYALTLVCLALGLMSKPMVVTLPFVLLLMDFWPLKRYSESGNTAMTWSRLVLEKIPFFALVALTCVATVWAQTGAHSVVSTAALPLSGRTANALVSYVLYLWKMVWPANLIIPYPYASEWTLGQAAGAGLLLLLVSGITVWRIRQSPQLAVGWFWFLGTLVPVIGLVQVGSQLMADRYSYIPLIGIFVMLAWSIPERWAEWPRPGAALGAVGAAVLIGLLMVTSVQLLHWRSSITLFARTISVTKESILAEYNLAEALAAANEEDLAIEHYLKALAIKPNRVEAEYNSQLQAHYNLGVIYWNRRAWPEAEKYFRACLKDDPNLARAHNSLGMTLMQQKRVEEAVGEFQAVTRLEPESLGGQQNLDIAWAEAGKFAEAIAAAERTASLARAQGRKELVDAAEKRLESYRAGKPYRER